MPAPSPYNRKLKAKNDRRKAKAAKGGRTPSEAGLAASMAAAGNKVSKSNQRVGAPRTKPKFGTPRAPTPRKARRVDYDSMTLDELARQKNLPKRYEATAELAAKRPDYDRVRDTQKIVGEDGKPLSRLEMAGQLAEVGSLVVPVGGGIGAAGRILATTGRTAPKAFKGAATATKAAKAPVKTTSKVKKAVKAAPKKAKARAAASGKRAKRNVKALGTKKGAAKAAKGAAKAPAKVARQNPAVATAAYAVGADKAGVGDPVTKTIAADTRGVVDAVDSPSDFLKTVETTGRAVPGIFAGVGAAGLAGGITAVRAGLAGLDRTTGGLVGKDYNAREIVSPVAEEGKKTIEGTVQMAKPFIEGDEEGVKEVVQEQVGLIPIVAGPKAISAARNSRAVQGVRQGTRTVASNRRNKKNEKIEAENNRQAAKGQRGTKAKKIKTSPTDRVYGGEYAIPRLGRAIEGVRGRSRSSKDAARAKAVADVRTARILRPVMKLARGIAVPKGKDAGDYRGAALNAMSTVLAYGIPRDYDKAVAWMADIERGIAMPDAPPKISDRGNFEFLRNNPEIFRDENFWKARDYLAKQQDEITTSEVKRYLGQGAALGIKNPDERLEAGVELADGTVVIRDRGRQEDQPRQRKMATLKNLRVELRAANKRGDMKEVERLTPIVARREKELKDQTQATAKAQRDFVEETKAAAAERGLETPTYVRSWGDREALDQAAPFPASGVLSQRNWIDRDTTRQRGESERAWEDFVRDSIYKPRAQRIYHDLVSEFAASNAIRLKSARGSSVFLTTAEIKRAIERGEINPDDHVAFHSQHFRSAVQDPAKINRETGVGAFFELDDAGRKALGELDAQIRNRAADKGNKYIVVPKPDAEELVSQFMGQNKWQKMANVNRLGSRIVLGYNPSWAVAQLVAEGIPTAVAVGLNPARLRRMRQATKERNQNPEMADLMDGTAGQTAGTTVIPKRDKGLDTRGRDIPTGTALTTPGRFGSEILSALKGEALGRFDRAKGGGFRKMVLAAQIDREVNGFMRGLGSFLKLDGQVKKKLKGMSPAEQQAYLLRNPKTARALEQYLDDVMGNWRAISSREEFAASLVAFYPYIRYSIKTAFWGFPKRHPIKSSILYFFAQLNANELEEIVGDGGNILDWVNYAYPVVSVDGEQKVAPGATRVAPALSVVAEAIGTNNLSRLLGGLNPITGAIYRGATGTDFTGEKIADGATERLLVGLAALTSMVAPYRAVSNQLDPEGDNLPSLRSYTPRRGFDDDGNLKTVIGGRSSTSTYLGERDIDRGLLSLINPFQLMDSQDFVERQQVIDALNRGAWRELPGSVTGGSGSSSSGTPIAGSSAASSKSSSSGGTPISQWTP